ncbi:MAG: hypothetical protein HGB08_04990 [Candidatus Moranbacteria bacterium]|nr:hypothetical protein [Candidatus Moranbacteria bacterium]
MNKKKIIIIAGIVVLLGCFEVLYFYLRKVKTDKNSSQSVEISMSSSYSSSQSQGSFSYQSSGTAGMSIITLTNPENHNLVRDAFLGFIMNPSSDLRWAEFRDSNNGSVSLDRFSSAMGIKIDEHLSGLLKSDSYNVFSCKTTSGIRNIGIEINIKLLSGYKGDLYQDEVQFLRNWEVTMLPDLKSVLFPNVDFSQKYLEQELIFKDGKYRYANVELPNNIESSINYDIAGDSILISNSLECLEKASNAVLTSD